MLESTKKDYQERVLGATEDYDCSLEGKAMTAEDFKGKLVERAELVAEQEE